MAYFSRLELLAIYCARPVEYMFWSDKAACVTSSGLNLCGKSKTPVDTMGFYHKINLYAPTSCCIFKRIEVCTRQAVAELKCALTSCCIFKRIEICTRQAVAELKYALTERCIFQSSLLRTWEYLKLTKGRQRRDEFVSSRSLHFIKYFVPTE